MAVSYSPIKKSMVEKTGQPVTEIAIRLVKDGMNDEFKATQKKLHYRA
ncbi:MAG: hypothetical protein R3C61_01640 [Bacteroidia bacterium]